MAFSVNYGRASADRRRRSVPVSASRFFGTILILFAAFCLYDYSAYGDGYVAHALNVAQRGFQEFMGRFRVRL